MKAYTNLQQSKKLAEILPLESADMWYWHFPTAPTYNNYGYPMFHKGEDIHNVPCWSLASLLEQLNDEITDDNGNDYNLTIVKEGLQYQLYYHDSWGQVEDIETDYYDDLVDACVEMIIKLHEMNLL